MDFLQELNQSIGPMLVAGRQETAAGTVFFVQLADSPFFKAGALSVTSRFTEEVTRIGEKHFGQKPEFNNNLTMWWF